MRDYKIAYFITVMYFKDRWAHDIFTLYLQDYKFSC